MHDILTHELQSELWRYPVVRLPEEKCDGAPGSDEARAFTEARRMDDELAAAVEQKRQNRFG
jgi:hypothetical protein